MNGVQRVRILDSSVDALDFDQALDAALALAKDKTKTSYVVAVNPEKVMTVNREPFLSSFFEDADLALPDGIGVVKRAPKLWRDIKLEWLYRLLSQPSRWRRQRVLPLFVCKVLWEYVARRFRR